MGFLTLVPLICSMNRVPHIRSPIKVPLMGPGSLVKVPGPTYESWVVRGPGPQVRVPDPESRPWILGEESEVESPGSRVPHVGPASRVPLFGYAQHGCFL